MPKAGVLNDYDLMANNEPAAQRDDFVCVICGASPPTYQWSDYHGEAMCQTCGCPYQLKGGTDEWKHEGNYPYLRIREKYVAVIQEYWNETHRWTCFGQVFTTTSLGRDEFNAWLNERHPELVTKESVDGS